MSDMRAGIGLLVPLGGSSAGAGSFYDFSYGRYSYSGFGWRAGVAFMPENMDIEGHIGFPVSVAYRSGLRNATLLDAGLNAAGGAIYDGVYGRTPTAGSLFLDFMYGLFSRGEFNLGLTPGYIGGEVSENDQIQLHGRFFVSADLSYTMMWRIGHVSFCVAPGFHYYLTKNFREVSDVYTYTDKHGNTFYEVSPQRWLLSLSASLAYSF